MPKMKSHSGLKKRLKKTGSGKMTYTQLRWLRLEKKLKKKN